MLIPNIGAPFLTLDEPGHGPELPKLPQISQPTFAGILVAIAGNVIISLALNCQKLAHKRLERDAPTARRRPQATTYLDEEEEDAAVPSGPSSPAVALVETEPLLSPRNGASPSGYGAESTSGSGQDQRRKKPWRFSRLFLVRKDKEHPYREADTSHLAVTHALMPVDVVPARSDSSRNGHANGNGDGGARMKADEATSEGNYLKSKLWWLGFLLMNVGELGNFISYAFAPASIVAPLGTFALIANCIFAPLMLKERFRKRDFLGIFIAIIGAITVVLSANTSDVRLDPQGLIHAVTQRPFLVYTAVYISGAIALSWLSEKEIGRRWVYVDVGLCALFGGFTVLSTKAISTLLTLEWLEIFTEWITYPVVAILLGTGIGQIRYLNRALMRFDSKIVVPTQFVLFNLSAIVGSALLYGDFIEASFHQIVTFLYGCAATFAGVFIIAWAPSPAEELLEDEELGTEALGSEVGRSAAGHSSISGSLSRANRVKLVVPEDASPSPILRSRHSIVSMYGLSPAQRVLLLSTPPRDEAGHPHFPDIDHELASTPDSISRRRTVSWLGDDLGHGRRRPIATPNFGTRDNSRNRAQSTTASRSVSRSPF